MESLVTQVTFFEVGKSLGSLLILGFCAWLALRWMASRVEVLSERLRIEPLVTEFAITTAKVILYIVVIVSALSSLGIQTHSLVAAIGAATLAVGLALQNSLSNLAAGILLAGNKVFKKLDYVEINGVAGKVESVGLLTTTLRTIDNKTVTIPNISCLSNNIINFSNFPTRRLDLRVSIAYEDDIVEAKRLLTDLFVSSPLVIDKSDFYLNPVNPEQRSINNVVFTIVNSELEKVFLEEAEKADLRYLKGHRTVGGMRASIYNSMKMESVSALKDFMESFEKNYG